MSRSDNQHEFEKWLAEKGIESSTEIVPLLKEAWNTSMSLACAYFGDMEGVDYGAESRYWAE